MYRLTSDQVAKYEPKMREAAPTTWSSGNPRPDLDSIMKEFNPVSVIGCIDSFGLKRYFDISSQGDMDSLIDAVKRGSGMSVSWFYLTDIDEEDW